MQVRALRRARVALFRYAEACCCRCSPKLMRTFTAHCRRRHRRHVAATRRAAKRAPRVKYFTLRRQQPRHDAARRARRRRAPRMRYASRLLGAVICKSYHATAPLVRAPPQREMSLNQHVMPHAHALTRGARASVCRGVGAPIYAYNIVNGVVIRARAEDGAAKYVASPRRHIHCCRHATRYTP